MQQTYGRTLLSAILLSGLLAACSAPDQSPTVQLSTAGPAQDSRPLTLLATVTSPASTPIAKVEFFKGDTKLGEDTSSPYQQEVPINVEADTTLEFSAKATDQQSRSGKKTLSVAVKADTQVPTVELSGSSTTFVSGGTLNLTATASDNVGVAKVEFYRGTTKLGEDTEAPYALSVPISATLNGANPFSAKAHDYKGLQSSSNTLSVNVDIDDVPPSISLTISSNNLNAIGSILLNATATDNKGIAKVEFYKGSSKLGEDTTSPYTFEVSYNESYNNTDTFSAKAIDLDGNSTTSQVASVAIDIDILPPTISLSGSSSSFSSGGTLNLSATASDNMGIAKVEFYKVQSTGGTTLLGQDSETPYTLAVPITAALNGNQAFSAKAYDHKGLQASSDPLSVNVDIDAVPPVVSLSLSTNSLNAVGSITLNATASDNKGVAKVEFYKGSSKLGEDTTSPYSFEVVYSESYNGTDNFIAKAIDLDGNSTTTEGDSATIDIDITLPSIVLTASNNSFTAAGSLTLSAAASDNRGVTRVEFFRGSTLLSTLTTAPYTHTLAFSASDNGQYNFRAKAFDAKGNVAEEGEAVTVAILPLISSFSANPTAINSDGGALGLNWAATNHSGFNLSVNSVSGLSGMPEGGALNASVLSQLLNVSANLTRFDRTYQFTLAAGGYGGVAAATQNLSITQSPAFSNGTAGGHNGCAFIAGLPHCWGHFNNLGIPGNSHSTSPRLVSQGAIPSGVSLTRMAAGIEAVCGLASDGWAYCWGSNLSGQLGDGTTFPRQFPGAVVRGAIPNGLTLTQISTKWYHTCAIASNNAAYCWGEGASGGLGNSGITSRIPIAVSQGAIPNGVTLSSISVGLFYTCALGSNGLGYCWGAGTDGRLGSGATTNSLAPVGVVQGARPANVTYTKISAGTTHTCALGSNGLVYCWGRNNAYQLGDGTTLSQTSPVGIVGTNLPSGLTFSDVVAGTFHSCALGSNAVVYCWGTGQAAGGSGAFSTVTTPTALAGLPTGVQILQLSAAKEHTCAIGNDKRAYCWGNNDYGQLGRVIPGNGTPGPVLSPVQ